MRHKNCKFVLLLALSAVICFPLTALAQMGPEKMHHGCGLEKKILCKLHSAMANQDALGLAADQIGKIKHLKISLKKDLIKRKAEIDIIGIDIKSKLSEDKLDKEGINNLIDQKYELKKAKTKALIDACAEMRNILTAEQREKLKKIMCQGCKCPKKSSGECPAKSPMKCPKRSMGGAQVE